MKKALVIINISKDESLNLAEEISVFLKEKNISCDFYSFLGFNDKAPFENYDFIVTLGGDGTVLFAARNSVDLNIPVFPVNLGEFGFIASVQTDEWKESLEAFLEGKSSIAERSMLKVTIIRNEKEIFSGYGLNDVVISARRAANIICLNVKYKDCQLCKLKADGVIISTPTGSTAYSAAAGGPILDMELDALVLTPINPFSLSSRPVVLNANGEIEINVQQSRTKEVSITVDGQEPLNLLTGDYIKITQHNKKIKLICAANGNATENFYNALRSKLNWAGGPHA